MFWGNSPWDGHRLGAQFLAEALAASHHVLFVDPPVSVVRAITGRRPGRPVARPSVVEPVADGLWRFRSLGLPGLRRPGVRDVNALQLRWLLRRAVRRLGLPVRAVISGYLDVRPFGFCGERIAICRVSDDFSTGRELGVPVERMARAQHEIAEEADAVVVVSPVLQERWARRGHDTILIPNGADTATLHGAPGLPRPLGIDLPDPIVGYSGQLSTRIDLSLLEAVADRGHSLLLVGGRRPDLEPERVAALLARDNLQWTGERPYDELPAYLGAMAVGLLPYTDSEFNQASFPLKLLEYLAAGVAPVSTDLPAVRWLNSDLVTVADTPETFATAVDEALAARDDDAEIARRQQFAEMHTWVSRADDYVDLFDRLDSAGGTQSSLP